MSPRRISFVRSLIVLFLLVGIAPGLLAQDPEIDWVSTAGTDFRDDARMAVIGPDGTYVAAGSYNYDGGGNQTFMYLVKFTPEGEILWERQYTELHILKAKDIIVHPDGGYLLTGYAIGDGDWQGVVLRVDEDGTELWRSVFGVPARHEVAWRGRLHPNGGYMIAGSTLGLADDDRDAFLVRLDDDGEVLWSELYGAEDEERITAMTLTPDGGVVMAGYTRTLSPTGYADVWIVRTDSSGVVTHEAHYGGLAEEEAFWVEPLPDDRYLLGGKWSSVNGSADVFVMTVDAELDSLSGFVYGEPNRDEWAQMVLPVSSGGYVITGNATAAQQGFNILTARLDDTGGLIWEHTLGYAWLDRGYAIRELPDHGYMVAGTITPGVPPDWELFVMRMTPDGNPVREAPGSGDRGAQPESPGLVTVYPNPFNGTATVALDLPRPGETTVELLDLLGRRVRMVHEGDLGAGSHRFTIGGEGLASGTYLLRVTRPHATWTRRVTLVR